jgi:DNA-binding transcriptional regulator YiaG
MTVRNQAQSPVKLRSAMAATRTAGKKHLTHWYSIEYHRAMNIEKVLRFCRTRSGLSQRALAERSATSHATLSAYENGRKSPTNRVAERVIADAGFIVEPFVVATVPKIERGQTRGEELLEVLELAAQFPMQVKPTLGFPVFGFHR